MGQVTVRVGGFTYPVGCADGQEEHLARMAAEVERRVLAIRTAGVQCNEARMLLLAALQLADELHDQAVPAAPPAPFAPAPPDSAGAPAVAVHLERLADRLEGIAATLQRP